MVLKFNSVKFIDNKVLLLWRFPKIHTRVGSVNRKTLRVDQSKTTSNEIKTYFVVAFELFCFYIKCPDIWRKRRVKSC